MTSKRLWKVMCAAVAVLASVPAIATAGDQIEYASCYVSPTTGAGGCYGTMLGFRNSSNPYDYAGFYTNADGSRSFHAIYNSLRISCVPNTTVAASWNLAMTAEGYFDIEWDGTGTCTYLSVQNYSGAHNY